MRLADVGLRLRERFLYEDDFIDDWQHDLRLEQILPLDSRRRYPVCIGGRRAAPPEDCGGPWAFLELRQRYSVFHIAQRLIDLLKPSTSEAEDDTEPGDHYEELAHLLRWLKIDHFERRAVTRHLDLLRATLAAVPA